MLMSIISASRLRASAAIGDFIITVNSGSGSGFTIPTSGSGYNYGVTTSDGQTFTGQTGNLSISFPASNTVYTINISGSFPLISIENGSNRTRLLTIENLGIYSQGSVNQARAFFGASNLVINASDSGFFGNVTDFNIAWTFCNSLTSFPLIDTGSGTTFQFTWRGCTSLTSFPLIDTSSATNFLQTWVSCSSLVVFPTNAFDSCLATNFANAFVSTNLSQASIDGILISINSNGTSNGTFGQSGGNAPSSTGESAITAMRSRGWSIVVTGGF